MDKYAENLNGTSPSEIAWNRIWGEVYDPETRNECANLLGTESRDDQIEKRRFTPLHRIALGLELGISIETQIKETDVDAPDASGRSALSYATARGDQAMSATLLMCNASVVLKQPGADALHWAVTAKDPSCIKLLLEYSADPNSRSVYGETSLHIAAMRYDDPERRMSLLLSSLASIDAQDYEGYTPLMFAVQKNRPKTVRYLLDKRANIDLADHVGSPAMAFAILSDNEEILDVLLQHPCDTMWQTERRQTWLHLAASTATSSVLNLLRDHGVKCDFNSPDKDGYTAEQIFDHRRKSRGADLSTIEAFDKLLASLRVTELSAEEHDEKA
ncbi:hypothetical protein J4E86_008851 [Alternaria arbusti]|uniref:uncharacterized protein n=1 Tax=Alternaria arbusti TaxID=232088 RepID=UPI00221E7953|nr:uncharacterized protein J4E86_008851 [Alternaria arbusti]KAI4946148.1 hypothetical protein J4E86_008851 [Alternaria arbusti]